MSWIDSFIRELYAIRNLLNTEEEPDPVEMGQVFEHAEHERGPLAGRHGGHRRPGWPGQRQRYPAFGESMSEMMLGRKGGRNATAFLPRVRQWRTRLEVGPYIGQRPWLAP